VVVGLISALFDAPSNSSSSCYYLFSASVSSDTYNIGPLMRDFQRYVSVRP